MNKKYGLYIFPLLCALCLTLSGSFAQTFEQAYDLRFQTTNGFLYTAPFRYLIDSTQVVDNGFHPRQLKYNNVRKRVYQNGDTVISRWLEGSRCYLSYSKTIILPENSGKEASHSVTLNYKSEIDGVRFFITVLDKEENRLYADSAILQRTDRWADIPFTFSNGEARAVNICLVRRKGRDRPLIDPDENNGLSLYLNKVTIRRGDRELNGFPFVPPAADDMQLRSGSVVPLSLQNDASLAAIRGWKDKQVIALGESVSGLEDILEARIQFMKYLITSENCRLILLEHPENFAVRWNLYLQGRRSELYEDKLFEELKGNFSSPQVWMEFFRWIREHNAKANTPVRVAGLEMPTFSNVLLADYLLAHSTHKQDSIGYLSNLTRKKRAGLKEYIVQSQIAETLNRQDLQYLLFLIDELTRPSYAFGWLHRITDSAHDQANRIGFVIDNYLSPSEKAVIVTSSRRMDKHYPIFDMKSAAWWEIPVSDSDSLGNYLHQRYGDKYHTVSFQVGERSCLVDSGSYENYQVRWAPPSPYAFDRAAMDSEFSYFYYPSDQLPDGVLGLNLFFRDGWNSTENRIPFRYCHIPSRFDALVFIREAKAVRDIKNYRSKLGDYLKSFPSVDQLLEELTDKE